MADPDTPQPANPDAGRTAPGPSAGRNEDRSFSADSSGPEGRSADDGAPRERGSRTDAPGADGVMPGREFGAGGQIDDGPVNTPGDPAAQARSAENDSGPVDDGPA